MWAPASVRLWLRAVAKNHVRPNGTFGVVVVSGDTGNVQKGEDLVFVLQDPGGKPLPIFVRVDSGGEMEESGLQPPDTLGKDGAGIDVPPLRQTVGVGQESL